MSEDIPDSEGGWQAGFASAAVSRLAEARRQLRQGLLDDAGDAAIPDEYVCRDWVGWPEIRAAARVIRRVRTNMISKPNPFDHLEFALSELVAVSSADDPPVLLLGVLSVTDDPQRLRSLVSRGETT